MDKEQLMQPREHLRACDIVKEHGGQPAQALAGSAQLDIPQGTYGPKKPKYLSLVPGQVGIEDS